MEWRRVHQAPLTNWAEVCRLFMQNEIARRQREAFLLQTIAINEMLCWHSIYRRAESKRNWFLYLDHHLQYEKTGQTGEESEEEAQQVKFVLQYQNSTFLLLRSKSSPLIFLPILSE